MPDRSKDGSPSKQPERHGSSSDLERFVVLDPIVEAYLLALEKVIGLDFGRVRRSPLAAVVILRVLVKYPHRIATKVLRQARHLSTPKRRPGRPPGRRSVDPSEGFLVMRAVDLGIPKATILRALGREPTKANYNWLARRVEQGRAEGLLPPPNQEVTQARKWEEPLLLDLLESFRPQ